MRRLADILAAAIVNLAWYAGSDRHPRIGAAWDNLLDRGGLWARVTHEPMDGER